MDLLAALKKKFVQDTLFIQSASVVNAFFQIILSIVLARLLGNDLYGRYAIIFALFNFFCVFLSWGPGASFVPQFSEAYAAGDKEEMERLIFFYWIVIGTVILIVFTIGFLTSDLLGKYFPLDTTQKSLVKILFFSLFSRPFNSLFLLITKCTRNMRRHALITCLQPFFFLLFTLMFLFWFGGIAAPIWGSVAAAYASPVSAYLFLRSNIRDHGISLSPFRLKNHQSITSMKSYFSFSFILSLDKNITSLTSILPTLFLGAFSTPEAAGFFRIGMGYAGRSELFFKGIQANTMVKLSENKGKKELKQMKENYWAVRRVTSKMSIVLTIIFLAVAPLFVLLYGGGYEGALPVMLILSVAFCSRGFFEGVFPFLKVMRWMNLCVYWKALTLVILIPVGIFLVQRFDAAGAAIWTLLAYTLYRFEGAVILRKKISTI
jgi:O-antigen/teichoic acid export membrane protein